MIQEALDGNIDLILCKSVSRFSRSVAECKKYTDMLRLKNVTVEFEKENLRTDDPSSDFLFSLMSAIAESESRSISENVRWAQRERVKRGEYNLGNNRILGYDSVNGKLVPNKDAEAVRLIFVLYANGERSLPRSSGDCWTSGFIQRTGHRFPAATSCTSLEMKPTRVTSSSRRIIRRT
jgi:DNA invertase Pin-like site-specific DNA recombinase